MTAPIWSATPPAIASGGSSASPHASMIPDRAQRAAPRLAADALLDLDRLGTEVPQHRRGDGALLPDGPVEDANSIERHHHGGVLTHPGARALLARRTAPRCAAPMPPGPR